MKQYLLLLAGLMILAPYGQADAKAVKLGRGNAYSVAADAKLNTGANNTQLKKGECETSEECPSDKKCMGYKCVDVCTQPTGKPGQSMARICKGKKCVADPATPHAFKCVDNCYNVVCKSGYTTEVSGDGCCCVATSCPSGQRLENGKCVANCTGVTCKSGYKAVSNDTGCCCEADASCQSGYSYNTTYKGCIKDTLTCNIGCAPKGCGIGSTLKPDTGYYIKSDGTCPACSTAIANCAACSISKLGDTPKCTKCNAGYYLSSGKCVACPANATCSGTSSFSCKSGYVLLPWGGEMGSCATPICSGSNCGGVFDCNPGGATATNPTNCPQGYGWGGSGCFNKGSTCKVCGQGSSLGGYCNCPAGSPSDGRGGCGGRCSYPYSNYCSSGPQSGKCCRNGLDCRYGSNGNCR